MPDIYMDVDTAIAEAPVNAMPLIDDTDFKTIEDAVVYNAAGMALIWHFVTTAGVMTETAVTPTTGGAHDWTDQGTSGLYALEIPASAGTINNDTEGFGWFTGVADGVLPWRGPIMGFRAAGLNNVLIDSAYSATRGLAGTAVPDAAADTAGGLVVSDAGGLDIDTQLATTDQIGAAGAGLTAINLPNQTMDITGNLSGSVGSVTGAVGSVTGGATSTAQTTAQNDLNKLTGTDGATLATAQGNYAPAKAGDNMGTVSSVTGNVDGSTASVLGGIDTSGGTITTLDALDTAQDTQHAATRAVVDDLAVKKNATFSNFEFLMVLTSDHVTPATGLTVTGQRSIDGAAFANATGSIAEVSNGIYQFDAVAADTNGDVITWRFSAATADDTFVTFKTVT